MKRVLLFVLMLMVIAPAVVFAQDTAITAAFNESQPNSLDPVIGTSVDDFLVYRNVCEGLTIYDVQTLEPIPALAETPTRCLS